MNLFCVFFLTKNRENLDLRETISMKRKINKTIFDEFKKLQQFFSSEKEYVAVQKEVEKNFNEFIDAMLSCLNQKQKEKIQNCMDLRLPWGCYPQVKDTTSLSVTSSCINLFHGRTVQLPLYFSRRQQFMINRKWKKIGIYISSSKKKPEPISEIKRTDLKTIKNLKEFMLEKKYAVIPRRRRITQGNII